MSSAVPPDGSLVAYEYTGAGLTPVRLLPQVREDLGTIDFLGNRLVLTAAHCVPAGADYKIVEIGFDVPGPGAQDQPWHRDFPAPEDTIVGRRLNSLAFNLTCVDVFGLSTARLDLRQHSGPHARAVAELLQRADYEQLPEAEKSFGLRTRLSIARVLRGKGDREGALAGPGLSRLGRDDPPPRYRRGVRRRHPRPRASSPSFAARPASATASPRRSPSRR